MSRASKLTLLGTSLFAATTIIFVHSQQKIEKDVSDPCEEPSWLSSTNVLFDLSRS